MYIKLMIFRETTGQRSIQTLACRHAWEGRELEMAPSKILSTMMATDRRYAPRLTRLRSTVHVSYARAPEAQICGTWCEVPNGDYVNKYCLLRSFNATFNFYYLNYCATIHKLVVIVTVVQLAEFTAGAGL